MVLRLATLFTVQSVGCYRLPAFNTHKGTFCPFKEKAMRKSTVQTATNQRGLVMAGAAAALAVAALGFAGGAQARDNVQFSVGVVIPGVQVGVANAYPVYTQPVYAQPIYVQPRPVYVQPPPVYVVPAPVYQSGWAPPGRAYGWHKRHGHHDRDDDDDRRGRHGRYDRDDDHRGGYRSGYQVQIQAQQPYVHGPQGFKPHGYYYDR